MPEPLLTRYLQPLLAGRRAECFDLIMDALRTGANSTDLLCDVIWPAMAQVERLYRDDRISTATEHMACRINRTAADQLQAHLPNTPANGKRAVLMCADTEHEELGAQMVGDLLQSEGWEVFLVGGGVPDDEILAITGQLRPQMLLIFGAVPEAVPQTRALIDHLHDINACPTMNIVVVGGIFNRADGLWREIGADGFADHLRTALELIRTMGPRVASATHHGFVKQRHRRRKGTPTPATAAV
ncbi:MAG: cobalamin-dependent protein [Phycisphaerales bacterium]|nr:cobalamin-dependent protein [Phycisphaerales bacterium]